MSREGIATRPESTGGPRWSRSVPVRGDIVVKGEGVLQPIEQQPITWYASVNTLLLPIFPCSYSSRSASTGATLDARSAGSNDAASTVASETAAPISSVRGSPGAMP